MANFKTTTAAARTLAVLATTGPAAAAVSLSLRVTGPLPMLSYFHQRVLEVHGPQTAVLAMGDFNDELFDVSLVRHAPSTRQRAKVTSAREAPLLWNLMWPIVGASDGSFYFDNQPQQARSVPGQQEHGHRDAPIKGDPATVQILKLPAMANPSVYPKPIPFGRMGKPVNQNGFSDHFPITMTVTEADEVGWQ
jgi:hypothetical protein